MFAFHFRLQVIIDRRPNEQWEKSNGFLCHFFTRKRFSSRIKKLRLNCRAPKTKPFTGNFVLRSLFFFSSLLLWRFVEGMIFFFFCRCATNASLRLHSTIFSICRLFLSHAMKRARDLSCDFSFVERHNKRETLNVNRARVHEGKHHIERASEVKTNGNDGVCQWSPKPFRWEMLNYDCKMCANAMVWESNCFGSTSISFAFHRYLSFVVARSWWPFFISVFFLRTTQMENTHTYTWIHWSSLDDWKQRQKTKSMNMSQHVRHTWVCVRGVLPRATWRKLFITLGTVFIHY